MVSSDLKTKVQEFVAGEISVRQLEDWIVPRLPYFLKSLESDDSDLVAAIELSLAELSDSIRSLEEVRRYLSETLNAYPMAVVYTTPRQHWNVTSSSNQNIKPLEWKVRVGIPEKSTLTIIPMRA
jgi:hypothetical protein